MPHMQVKILILQLKRIVVPLRIPEPVLKGIATHGVLMDELGKMPMASGVCVGFGTKLGMSVLREKQAEKV